MLVIIKKGKEVSFFFTYFVMFGYAGCLGQFVGGISGSGTIYNGINSGSEVEGGSFVGGIAGFGSVYNSSSRSDIRGTKEKIGGIIANGSVSRSHAVGKVTGDSNVRRDNRLGEAV